MSTAARSPSSSSIRRRSSLGQVGIKRERRAYIIRNARLDPDYAASSERRTISIAGRAINTMLASSGRNDVLRIYFITQRDGVDYNLAYIGARFRRAERRASSTRPTCARSTTTATGRPGRAWWHKAPPWG